MLPAGQARRAFCASCLAALGAARARYWRAVVALGVAGPRMAQDVAALEVLAVAGLLEDEVLGEVLARRSARGAG